MYWRRSIALIYGHIESRCTFDRACGNVIGIDCYQAADGPYYYVNAWTGGMISTCGGACMGGNCTNCPPVEWTCN
jgi:hypothetical protein